MSLRVSPATKLRLESAAAESGHSLSQEAEFLLEKSFDREASIDSALDLAYGRPAAELLLILAREMVRRARIAALVSGGPRDARMEAWPSDPYAYDQAAAAATAVIEGMRPVGDPAALKNGSRVADLDNFRKGAAKSVNETLAVIKDPARMGRRLVQDQDQELEQWASRRRERLGPFLNQIHDFADEDTLAPITTVTKKGRK